MAVKVSEQADQWWRSAVIYQVYPRSFADSNGDGIGDLGGVRSRLDYLQRLGVDALWFSPFYPSPQRDAGYDVADYFSIDPQYGSLEEFTDLLDDAHERGMRVLIDVVPNHSSTEHPLFKLALESEPGSAERDRYIFRYGGDTPPNNWGSIFGGPAWSEVEPLSGKEEDRGWWYLHLFDSTQADFNWDSPDVRHLFEEYFRYWLDLGVDGFRVDVAHGLIKAPGLPDDELGLEHFNLEPAIAWELRQKAPYFDQEEVHDVYRAWRKILEEYGPDKMMIGEISINNPQRWAAYLRSDEMHQGFTFTVTAAGWNAGRLRRALADAHENHFGLGAVNTWVLSNHDVVRHASRLGYPSGANLDGGVGPADPRPDERVGLRRAIAYSAFLFAIPGSVYLYNGEELGLPEVLDLPDGARQDPAWERTGGRSYGRDGCRVPLPWTDSPDEDWGSNPWLPLPAGWEKYAASKQEDDPESPLNRYRKMLALRKELDLGEGKWELIESDPDVVAVKTEKVLAAINLGVGPRPVSEGGRVLYSTGTTYVEDGALWIGPNDAVWVDYAG